MLRWTRLLLLFVCMLLGATTAWAQEADTKTLRGVVRDAETGAPLPAANLFVEGTRRGTITNDEGRYRLPIRSLPATVVVRHVGYEKERLQVAADTPAEQNVTLASVATPREQVTVTARRETAADIMRRVIATKEERRRRLYTFAADAYNRFTVRNDTGIVSVTESLTRYFWDEEEGTREVVRSQRQTKNLGLDSVLPAGLFVTNLYDDEIEVAGYRLIGVTHPDALDHYRFRIDSVRALGERAVFDMAVEPRGRFKSAFTGHIAVLDEAYTLLEADLTPARSFLFPPPIQNLQITYQQQFADFGKDFWLPISLRSQVQMKVSLPALLSFPAFHIDQVSRLSDYDVNAPLPDSLYAGDTADRVWALRSSEKSALPADSLIAAENAAVVPLSHEETRAVTTIDSTHTLDQAFAPSGPLAMLLDLTVSVDGEEGDSSEDDTAGEASDSAFDLNFSPRLWYNRVEGAHLGARTTFEADDAPYALSILGGYQTARADFTYGGGLEVGLPGGVDIEASYRHGVDPRYTSRVYALVGADGRFMNSLSMLGGGTDYFDYYGNERWRFRAARDFSLGGEDFLSEGRLRAGVRIERSFPVERNTSYDLLGRDAVQPSNPPVGEQALRSMTAGVRLGHSPPGAHLGITGQRRLSLAAEWSPEGFLGSETRFFQVRGTFDYEWETFLQRRLLPMTLHVRLAGGTFAGRLPLQRYTIVEGPLVLEPFGTLRTLDDGRPYQGEQHLAMFWEHDFRTLPFEAAGLYGLAERGWNVLLFGGHGRTWAAGAEANSLQSPSNVPERFHHEVGVGLSGLLGVLRVDLAKRIDAKGWSVSLGFARLY